MNAWGKTIRRHTQVGVVLLFLQVCQVGFGKIPPVTLSVIGFNVAVYLRLVHPFFNKGYPEATQVCVGVKQVWNQGQYWRLVESTFYHADDMHLYFNMVSFLWKGLSLERKITSRKFVSMIAIFSVFVNLVMLYLNYVIALCFRDNSYLTRCAVGFSGVIFAVKIISTYMVPKSKTLLLGVLPISSRVSCWFELLLIQILVPNASFTGHLAGILVGLAFTRNPCKRLLDLEFPDCSTEEDCPPYPDRNLTPVSSESDMNSLADGTNEDEQIRRAIQESLYEESSRSRSHRHGEYPFVSEGYNTRPTAPPLEDIISPPPYGWNLPPSNGEMHSSYQEHDASFPGQSDVIPPLPPDLTTPPRPDDREELRRRRLARFGNLPRR